MKKAFKPQKRVIRNAFERGQVLMIISAFTDFKSPLEVSIKKFSEYEGITDAQRRLYWQCMTDLKNTDINELAGKDKDDWHAEMKEKFLINIYSQNDSDFAKMVAALKNLRRFPDAHEEYTYLRQFVLDETSIMRKFEDDELTGEKGNAKAIRVMREYLTKVMDWARFQGVRLKIDSKLLELAMMEASRYGR